MLYILYGEREFHLPRESDPLCFETMNMLQPFQGRRGGGFIGQMIRWFIMVAIYDICIGTIANVLGVSRLVAVFIFLGILLLITFIGFIVRQKMAPPADQ